MVITDTPKQFNDKIAIDVIGPFPESRPNEYKYVLTIQDSLTKYLEACPMQSQTSIEIIQALSDTWLFRFGPPRLILSDRGAAFMSEIMNQLCESMQIDLTHTTAFHPESNGSLERTHAVIKDYLRGQILTEDPESWEHHLQAAIYAYNSAEHSSTGFAPYELVYGRPPPLLRQLEESPLETYEDYAQALTSRASRLQQMAQDALHVSKQKNKELYDKTQRPLNLQPGDYVWIKNPRDKPKRLGTFWTGPYKVVSVNGVNADILVGKQLQTLHLNRLKYANHSISDSCAGQSEP